MWRRMAAHRALAAAVDDDRRAWHLAAVTRCPDDAVAGRLENLALCAQRRGGQAAVSAAYARAAELSGDPAEAARRWIGVAVQCVVPPEPVDGADDGLHRPVAASLDCLIRRRIVQPRASASRAITAMVTGLP